MVIEIDIKLNCLVSPPIIQGMKFQEREKFDISRERPKIDENMELDVLSELKVNYIK